MFLTGIEPPKVNYEIDGQDDCAIKTTERGENLCLKELITITVALWFRSPSIAVNYNEILYFKY